jgi:uncharacterized protein (TIGR01627 family)
MAGGRPPPPEFARLPDLGLKPIKFGPVRILAAEPPVFLTGTAYDEYLGLAPAFGRRYGNTPAAFIIFPTWSVETPALAGYIAKLAAWHRQRYDRHRLRYIANSAGEAELLTRAGEPALFLNHKFTVSETVFRPLETGRVEFDAIYNARFTAGKRHELAALIEKVAYVAYAEPQQSRRAEFQALSLQMRQRGPGHVLLNPLKKDLPAAFSHAEVNAALNRAAVGLLLSEIEGASYAAVEYLLAGLPVVSTRSVGGREAYFDPEYCAVVEPDPRAVRDAVAALRARNIPRDYVRQRTLDRLAPERRRFLALVDEMLADLGAAPRFAGGGWPFGAISGVPWDSFKHHLARLETEKTAALARAAGLDAKMLEGVQLTPAEIAPIAAAIRARPGCALLVFGCGNDSPLWETLNAGGVTAFIEDNAKWAAETQGRLRSATVFLTQYGTKRRQWRRLLRRPETLALALPDAIRSRTWDVILVDGPAGHRGDVPGRMKSIYEAARLVAPGGAVFVHDAERPVEATYAARYLGGGRVFVKVRGRALLTGHQF